MGACGLTHGVQNFSAPGEGRQGIRAQRARAPTCPSVPAALPAPPPETCPVSAAFCMPCSHRRAVCGHVPQERFPAGFPLPPSPLSPAVGNGSAPRSRSRPAVQRGGGGILPRPCQPPASRISRRVTRSGPPPGWMSTTSSRLHLRQNRATPAPVVSGYSRMSRFALQAGQETNTPSGVATHGTTPRFGHENRSFPPRTAPRVRLARKSPRVLSCYPAGPRLSSGLALFLRSCS